MRQKYRWRTLIPIQGYANSPVNVGKRREFARDLIRLIESGKEIWNLDESAFTTSNSWRKGWVVRGKRAGSQRLKAFSNITLTSVITFQGEHFYTLLKGTNNQWVFSAFLRQMVKQLDLTKPKWRENSVLLMDNGPLHKTDLVMDTIDDLKLPVMFTSPASYPAVPVELVFSRIK